MKKITISTMLLAFAMASFGQQAVQKQPSTQADYLKKSKGQNAAGWLLTGGGTTVLLAALLSFDMNLNGDGGTPFIIGGALIAGGGILFIISGKNKRKAKEASVFINMEKIPPLAMIRNQSFPAIELKISL